MTDFSIQAPPMPEAVAATSPGRPAGAVSATPMAAGTRPANGRDGAPSNAGKAFARVFAGLQATTGATAAARPGGSDPVPGIPATAVAGDAADTSVDPDTAAESPADATLVSSEDPWADFAIAADGLPVHGNGPGTAPPGNGLPVAGRPLPSDTSAVALDDPALDDPGLRDQSSPDAAEAAATARHAGAAVDGDRITADEGRVPAREPLPGGGASSTGLSPMEGHTPSGATRGSGMHEPADTAQAGAGIPHAADAGNGNGALARELAALLARPGAGAEGSTMPREAAAFADSAAGEALFSPATGTMTGLRAETAAGSGAGMAPDRFALAPLDDARWADGLADRMQRLASDGGSHSVRLRLYPEHLGSLDVRMRVEDDNVQLWFNSPHAQVREALEASLPRLREMFAGQGLCLQDTAVGSDPGAGDGRAESGDARRDLMGTTDERNAQSLAGLLDSLQLRPDPRRLVDVWA